jgi:hypothetical protein
MLVRRVHAAVLVSFLLATTSFAANTPVILSLDPKSVIAGSSSFTLTVNGANFVGGAVVRVNGSSVLTNFVSASQLTAVIPFAFLANAASLSITATNPGSLASSAVTLPVLPNNPQITSLDPPSVPIGTQPVTVRVIGSNFASSASVRVSGFTHATTFVSDSQLSFTLAASEVSKAASLAVVVVNPNNRLSNSETLPVTSGATPSITLISPRTVAAGGGSFALTVIGTGFVNGSSITGHGTTFIDGSHLTTTISSFDTSKAGSLPITVTNPNSASSNTVALTITNGNAPTIQSISPASVAQSSPPFTLSILGTNFISGAKVNVGNNAARNAAVIDAQHLTVGMFASDSVSQGSIAIRVTTPPPSGGTSNAATFTVVSQFAPGVTSMSPATVAAGSPDFKVLITGSNFKTDDIVKFDGNAIPTELISATQIAGAIDSTKVVAAGTSQITVARKDNSGTSAPLTLTITDAAAPTIDSLSPESVTAGSSAMTLAISGHNFSSASVVTVDDAPRNTTFVSPTELRITLTSGDLASAHDYRIEVANPGNLVAPAVIFSVVVPQPSISAITPDSVISGDAGFDLTVNGANFSATSVINVNGNAHTTQLSSGALTTSIAASEIAAPGSLAITVSDHGATSSAAMLKVLRPNITSIDPQLLTVGALLATVHVTGTSFLPTSKVIFKGAEQPTKANDDGSLTFTINGGDLVDPGDFAINVRNGPSSLSAPVILTIVSAGTPQITSIATVTLGATVMIVNGNHFVPLSVVQINGADRITTFISGTQLNATLLPSDAAATGSSFVVSVRNPDGLVASGVSVTVAGPPVIPPRRRGVGH